MKKKILFLLVGLLFIFLNSGCNDKSQTITSNKKIIIDREHYFKKDKIHYKWNFIRNYNKKISKVLEKDLAIKSFNYRIYNDTLALVDWENNNIILYNSNLETLIKIGKKGNGTPDENGKIMYFGMFANKLLLYDFDKLIMKKLNFSGDLIEYKKMPRSFRGKNIINDKFIITFLNDSSGIKEMAHYSYSNNKIKNKYSFTQDFPQLIKNKSLVNNQILAGKFDNGNNTKYSVYFFNKAGYFIINNQNEYKTYQTIDKTPLPKGMEENIGGGFTTYRTKPDVDFFLSATTDKHYLYLLNNITDHEKSKNKVIDYYNLRNGEYQGSINVPDLTDGQTAHQIAIDNSGKFIYVYYDNLTMLKYEIQ